MPALDQVDAMEAGEAGPSSRRGSDPEPVTDALMVSGAGEFGGAQMAGSIPPSCNPSFAQWDNRAAPSRPSADLLQQRVDATDAIAAAADASVSKTPNLERRRLSLRGERSGGSGSGSGACASPRCDDY